MEISIGYYVSYVQIWQARGPSVHKKNPGRVGRRTRTDRGFYGHGRSTRGPAQRTTGQSEGPEPSWTGSSDPMRVAGLPSTSGKWKSCVMECCARPTGGSHGRTTEAPEQRFNGVNLRGTLEVG